MRGLTKPFLLALCLLLGLVGCSRRVPPAPTAEEDMVPLGLSILNYTDQTVETVTVDGSWAGGLGPHAGGGKFAGATAGPRQWRADYTLTVRWQDNEQFADPVWRSGGPMRYHERRLAVQPYQQAEDRQMAIVWIAFLPGDVVKLYPTWVGPEHPDFPDGLTDPSRACAREFPGDPKCFSRVPEDVQEALERKRKKKEQEQAQEQKP